jgi:hypothetical protein
MAEKRDARRESSATNKTTLPTEADSSVEQKNAPFKHLTSKLQVSPNFTLDSVTDSNYRGKCDVGGFLIFEWTGLICKRPVVGGA